MKRFLISLLAVSGVFLFISNALAAYIDKSFSGGEVRIVYNPASPQTTDAIILGVGTAMSRSDYDNLANAIIQYGYVVVILDHNPGNMIKTDSKYFRNGVHWIQSSLLGWLAATNIKNISHWIVGGHSAGGQAAQGAVSEDITLADAIFSIDPYNCNSVGFIGVPAAYWGFDTTTCFVTNDDAGSAGYKHACNQRVFYKVKNQYILTICGIVPKIYHCSFCDSGCPGCYSCQNTPSAFYQDVARSANKFITAAFYGTWSKANLNISPATPLTMYEGSDWP